MPLRDIAISGSGVLIVGTKRIDHIQYEISGTKRSMVVASVEKTVMSADLRGRILNPEVVDFASQSKTMDISCVLIRNDGRQVAIDVNPFPRFSVLRAADTDAWSDAVLRPLEASQLM